MGLYRVSGGSITWGSPIALNSWMVCFMDNPTIRHFSMDEQCPKWIEMDRCLLVNCWDGYNMIYLYIYTYIIHIYIYYDPNMGTHVYKWLIMYCVKPLSLYRSPCWRAESLGLWPKDHSRYEHFRLCPWILLDSTGSSCKQTSPMEGFRSQKPRNSGYIWVYLGTLMVAPMACPTTAITSGSEMPRMAKNGVPTNWLIHNNLPHLRKD